MHAQVGLPFQAGFVPGISIHENIIIVKEVMCIINQKKGKKGMFIVKIDLFKAYDKISWEFIWQVLIKVNLLVEFINIIMHVVTSTELNVNWHGTHGDFFRPQ